MKHWEKLAQKVDGRRGGGTRKSRRNCKIREKQKRYGILSEMMQASWPIKLEENKLRKKAYEEL